MIVADSSALVAAVLGESEARAIVTALHRDVSRVSAVSIVESSVVLESRQGPDATRDLELLLERSETATVAVDQAHVRGAVLAWRRFGKGRHPARLNLGDCFAYATAKLAGAPLLFMGDDFTQTDIASVL